MAHTEEASAKAIVMIKEEGSISKAVATAQGKAENNRTAELSLPSSDRFYKVLKKAGITEKQLANSLKELLSANKLSVDKQGKILESPDNPVRLKTIELLLKYFVPENSPTQNHLHLHGKKLDELLSKDTGA